MCGSPGSNLPHWKSQARPQVSASVSIIFHYWLKERMWLFALVLVLSVQSVPVVVMTTKYALHSSPHGWGVRETPCPVSSSCMAQCKCFVSAHEVNTKVMYRLSQPPSETPRDTETSSSMLLRFLHTCLAELTPDVLCFANIPLEWKSHPDLYSY